MVSFSILVVLYYSPLDDLEESIVNQVYRDFEVILVDNSEDEGYFSSVEAWVARLPPHVAGKVRPYKSPRNSGYAGGNNFGFSKASGEYILVLNPDVVIGPEFLEVAEKVVRSVGGKGTAATWGVISPKVFTDSSKRTIQTTYTEFHPRSLRYIRYPGRDQPDSGEYDSTQRTFYAPGGVMLVRRDVFKSLRGFDEDYFMYFEDADFSVRARQLGVEVVYFPKLTAVHHHPTKENSTFTEKMLLRNKLLFFSKHYPLTTFLLQTVLSFGNLFAQVTERGVETSRRGGMGIGRFSSRACGRRVKYRLVFPLLSSIVRGFALGLVNYARRRSK
ncbi:MAG: glycosyltransferase family 2 protein [Promethearchaeota archaeon]